MKKNVFVRLFASFCLFAFFTGHSQSPTITVQAGFPVNLKSGQQVAYGNGKYVLLTGYNNTASFNTLYGSSTGTSWSHISPTNLATTQLNNIAFGAGLFVAVGNGGIIQTSADGLAWTNRTSNSVSNLYKAYFINGKFFAVGENRTVLTSADGITWSTMAFSAGNAADAFMSLAYGNGVYILAARNSNVSNTIIYRSTTAADNSWTYSANSLGLGEMVNRIQYLNNKFFVFEAGNKMYTSTNGASWTDFTASVVLTNPDNSTTSWNTSHQIFNGVWDGTKYSFYGSSAYYSGYGSVFTSTDGVNFTLLNKTAYIVPQESNYINGLYLVCGNEGIVSSSDGINYQHSGPAMREMVKTANKYVTVGMISQEGQIENSTDFSTWTSRRPAGTKELYTVAYDGTKLLAGGSGAVLSSTDDGDTWTTAYSNVAETFTALAYGNGLFVGGGWGATAGFLRYSTNGGVTWTNATTPDYSYWKIKYVNNVFFALGYDNSTYTGTILYSTDGMSWTDVTPNLGFEVMYYKDVAFDGTKYHFFGVESASWVPVQFFTVSTATPAVPASYGNKAVINNMPSGAVLGGSWDEGVLDYSAGKFTGAVIDVATGQDYIITSTDGSSWTALPQDSYSSISASYVTGSTVRLIGRGDAFFTVNYGSILPTTLVRFEGRLDKAGAQLNWTTASEQRSKQFLVQHSTNGNAWTTVGTVAATGNSTQGKQYSFLHPTPAKGINFYRLLMQDADGKTKQSNVITLSTSDNRQAMNLYPNPVADRLLIRTPNSGQGQVVLYNGSGQVVKTAALTGNETAINVSGLPGGIYRAVVSQGTQRCQLTVVKN